MFVFNTYHLKTINENSRRQFKRYALVMAVLMLICGVCALIYPLVAGWYLSYVTGMMFMMIGFYTLYSLIVFRKHPWKSKVCDLFFAIAWLLLGYNFIANPLAGMESLSLIFCFLFIVGGFSRIVNGFQMSSYSGWGWNLIIGTLDLLIAGLWLSMGPQKTYFFTTVFIGVEMIFSAWGLLSARKRVISPQWEEITVLNKH